MEGGSVNVDGEAAFGDGEVGDGDGGFGIAGGNEHLLPGGEAVLLEEFEEAQLEGRADLSVEGFDPGAGFDDVAGF